jgi:hypothetical protein
LDFPAGFRGCILLYSVQTGPGAHPASYSKCTGFISKEVKRPGRENLLLMSSERVLNDWSYKSISQLAFVDLTWAVWLFLSVYQPPFQRLAVV